MIDSMNPRILASNIRELFKKISSIEPGTSVEGNPSGSGYNTLLTKIKIGSSKYKLPADVTANPEGEATDSLSKLGIGSGIFSVGSTLPSYSTTEFDTGKKWIDGSTIYGLVYEFATPLEVAYNAYTSTGISTDADFIISITGYEPNSHACYNIFGYNDNGTLKVQTSRNGAADTIGSLYFEYTKTES